MAIPVQKNDVVYVTDRGYNGYQYQVNYYIQSGKIDLHVTWNETKINLKLSRAEAEDLITQLQFALHRTDNE